jgi:dTDP-L-rhamnose 4-epimerase
VVEATVRCIEAPVLKPVAFNVGTGRAVTVCEVVKQITDFFSSRSKVSITGAFREGDIRHNCADIGRLRTTLGFVPKRQFEDGVQEFLAWAGSQDLRERDYEHSLSEMRARGFMHG